MYDPNPWVGVVGAAVGGMVGLLAAPIKHWSDIRQKKLDRKWMLEDEDRKRLADAERGKDQRRTEALGELDELLKFKLTIASVKTPEEGRRALAEMQRWVNSHLRWLRIPVVEEFYKRFLTESFIVGLTSDSTQDGLVRMHSAQSMLEDRMSYIALYKEVAP